MAKAKKTLKTKRKTNTKTKAKAKARRSKSLVRKSRNPDAKTLVVVESPSKAKTIEKYLGKDYEVVASKGHIIDLPKSGLGVDVDNDFDIEYSVMPGKEDVIEQLKAALEGKNELIIAVDPDREGEAIGWHVANQLGAISLPGKRTKSIDLQLKRIVFTEITKTAVQAALKNPRKLDEDLLNAQQTRRVLDRLVGYKLSPLLWKKIRFGLSAGRVQSVAVKLIVEREELRDKFQAEEYWNVFATTNVKPLANLVEKPDYVHKTTDVEIEYIEKNLLPNSEIFSDTTEETGLKFELAKLNSKKPELANLSASKKTLEPLRGMPWIVDAIDTKQQRRHPKPPFTTSTMQQTAANWFGYSAKKTMTVAQKLYENGFITYMRTDSTNMSNQAVTQARGIISQKYGAESLPEQPNYYKTKSKVAQEAHEAIRPADLELEPNSEKIQKLPAEQQQLYKLIWQRALGSQFVPAIVELVAVVVKHKLKEDEYEFRATGQKIIKLGYLSVYPEKFSEALLPDLKPQDVLELKKLFATQHFTQPPARFSEASLIKELEKFGIGRPSTYAPIISTIQARGYVTKENKYLFPTDSGIVVTRLLKDHFPEIVDAEFTAHLENGLDEIANGELDWQNYLATFYTPFAKQLTEKESKISRDDYTVLGPAPESMICPDCGSEMVIKLSKYGKFYSCKRFPDCKGMLNLEGKTEEDVAKEAQTDEFRQTYQPAPKTDDNRDFLLKSGRFGNFWAHPDYPKVKDARPLEYLPAKLKELFGDAPQTDDGRDFLFKTGKFGNFWAHPDYPKVKDTVRIKPKSTKDDSES